MRDLAVEAAALRRVAWRYLWGAWVWSGMLWMGACLWAATALRVPPARGMSDLVTETVRLRQWIEQWPRRAAAFGGER